MSYARERSAKYGKILRKIRGIVFFAVPHNGSNIASAAGPVACIFEHLKMPWANPQLLKALEKESKLFFDVAKSCVERSEDVGIWSFYEPESPIVCLEENHCVVLATNISRWLPSNLPASLRAKKRLLQLADRVIPESANSILWSASSSSLCLRRFENFA